RLEHLAHPEPSVSAHAARRGVAACRRLQVAELARRSTPVGSPWSSLAGYGTWRSLRLTSKAGACALPDGARLGEGAATEGGHRAPVEAQVGQHGPVDEPHVVLGACQLERGRAHARDQLGLAHEAL